MGRAAGSEFEVPVIAVIASPTQSPRLPPRTQHAKNRQSISASEATEVQIKREPLNVTRGTGPSHHRTRGGPATRIELVLKCLCPPTPAGPNLSRPPSGAAGVNDGADRTRKPRVKRRYFACCLVHITR